MTVGVGEPIAMQRMVMEEPSFMPVDGWTLGAYKKLSKEEWPLVVQLLLYFCECRYNRICPGDHSLRGPALAAAPDRGDVEDVLSVGLQQG